MDPRTLKDWLNERPDAALLDAVDGGEIRRGILPMLEAELHRSSQRLQRLKEYRNSLASHLYCLQPELISNIFYLYARDNDELFDLRWTRLLLVCRRWHRIAMDTQKLWSFIHVYALPKPLPPYHAPNLMDDPDDSEMRRIEAQRSRAGQSLLTVDLNLYRPMSSKKLAHATAWNSLSLRSLVMAGSHPNIDSAMQALAGKSYVALENLSIVSPYILDPPVVSAVPTSLDIALGEQMQNMPRLRNLTVKGHAFTWSSLRGLRTLEVSCDARISVIFTIADVIEALSRCPRLTSLCIDLPYTFQPGPSVPAAISLPSLREIAIKGAHNVCTDIVQALQDRPRSARVIISTSSNSDTMSASALASRICDHLGPLDVTSLLVTAPTAQSIDPWQDPILLDVTRMGFVGQRRLTTYAVSAVNWLQAFLSDEASQVGFELEVPIEAKHFATMEIMQRWPLAHTTHLDLRSAPVTDVYLNVLLGNLPALTTVVVGPASSNAQALLQVLRSRLRERGERVLSGIVFDTMNALSPQEVQSLSDNPPSPPEALVRSSLISTLVFCSEAAQAGVPLDTVEIINEPQSQGQYWDPIFNYLSDIEWSELHKDLAYGFVYEGVLYSDREHLNGRKQDSSVAAVGD